MKKTYERCSDPFVKGFGDCVPDFAGVLGFTGDGPLFIGGLMLQIKNVKC